MNGLSPFQQFRHLLPSVIVYGATILLAPIALAQEQQPEGEIRKPQSGRTVDFEFSIEGRTRNLEKGWSIYLFTQGDKSRQKDGVHPGMFPHGDLEKMPPNRRFELNQSGKPPGKTWIYLYAMPPGRHEFIVEWRKKFHAHVKRFGTSQGVYPTRDKFFDGSILLAEVDVVISEPEFK